MNNKQTVIFDLDGTLADIGHRLHHIKQGTPNWDAFNEACLKDKCYDHIATLLASVCVDHNIVICTGRSESIRNKTIHWLIRNDVIFDSLYMRKEGDFRSDVVVKKEMLEQMRKQGHDVLLAFEDRSRVVQMWRDNGVPCLQVREGDY